MWLPVLTAYLVFFILLLLFAFHLYNKKYSDKWWVAWMFVCIIAMWGLYWLCMLGAFGDDKLDDSKSWITAGTFGDMFGALNCLFTGLAFGGVVVNLYFQGIQIRTSRAQSRHDNVIQMCLQLHGLYDQISYHKDPAELDEVEIGAEAVKAMLESVVIPLDAIKAGLETRRGELWKRQDWGNAESIFNEFLLRLGPILPLQSQAYFILRYIDDSSAMDDVEKKEFAGYLTFNTTPETKQLLNLLYLDARISQNLDGFHDLFNEGKVYRQLHIQFPDYAGEPSRIFIESMKALELCLRAGKYNKEERSQWATRPKFYD